MVTGEQFAFGHECSCLSAKIAGDDGGWSGAERTERKQKQGLSL